MTPCPDCAEHLETIRALGETCDRLVREREDARAQARRADDYNALLGLLITLAGQDLRAAMAARLKEAMDTDAVATQRGGGARLHPPAEAGD